jgi:hypothetical protein
MDFSRPANALTAAAPRKPSFAWQLLNALKENGELAQF